MTKMSLPGRQPSNSRYASGIKDLGVALSKSESRKNLNRANGARRTCTPICRGSPCQPGAVEAPGKDDKKLYLLDDCYFNITNKGALI